MPCLTPEVSNRFKKGLSSGEINPQEMSNMNSEQRRAFLSKYVGKDNVEWVNAAFEGKLLLKNQKRGMITWAKGIAGLKPGTKKDIISKIEKLDTALTKANQEKFLQDLVNKRLGVSVSEQEANTIMDLTKKTQSLKKGTMEYGRAKQKLVKFMREHGPVEKISSPAQVAGFLRTIMTAFDRSAILRQLRNYAGTRVWFRAVKNSYGYARSQAAMDELEARMYGHKYSDQVMEVKKHLGLTMLGETFTQREEDTASKFSKMIPGVAASTRAYEGILNDLRFSKFVELLEAYEQQGRSMLKDKAGMKDLAKVISAASGRGSLGKLEALAGPLSQTLFSPKWFASKFQIWLNTVNKRGPAQREAIITLARGIGTSAAVSGLISMAFDGDKDDDDKQIEMDYRSSDAGKAKSGNTRFDITGGTGAYVVLLTRLITGEIKSTTTGKIIKLNSGEYNSPTRLSIISDFVSNKTSPVASVVRDWLRNETFSGDEFNFGLPKEEILIYLAKSLLIPMIATETYEAYQGNADNKIAYAATAYLASRYGVSTQTYGYRPRGKNWDSLKDADKKAYDKGVAIAREEFQAIMAETRKDPSFNEKPETGEGSKAEEIDMIKRIINEIALELALED